MAPCLMSPKLIIRRRQVKLLNKTKQSMQYKNIINWPNDNLINIKH